MLIKDTPPEVKMRARILGTEPPSCGNCIHFNETWSASTNNEMFCSYHVGDPEPESISIWLQLCMHWAP